MKRILSILPALAFTVLLLAQPNRAQDAVREGLLLAVRTIMPSLFPFFAVTSLLLKLGLDGMLRPFCAPFMAPLFRMRGECAAPLITGLLGGYPAGARAAAELYSDGTLTRREGELLLGFCNNCSPGFLVGFVGAGVLGSTRAGVYLYLIHTAAALLVGVILCRLPRSGETPLLPCSQPAGIVSFPKALTLSVSSALSATLSVSAYVVLFRTAAALLPPLPPVMLGVVEMVSGVASLRPDAGGFAAAAALTAWGGLSVHCQSAAVAGELSMKYHTVGKILQAGISLLLALITANMVYR